MRIGFGLSLTSIPSPTVQAVIGQAASGASTAAAATLRQWLPEDVASTVSWGDADDLSAGSVTSWGHIAALNTTTNAPTYEATGYNGKPSVKGDGVNDWLYTTNAGVVGCMNGTDLACTVVLSCQSTATTAGLAIWSFARSSTSTPLWQLRTGAGPVWVLEKHDDTTGTNTRTFGTLDTNPHVITCTQTGTAVNVWLDGVQVVTNVAQDVDLTTIDRFGLFGKPTGANGTGFAPVRARRWAVFNAALSSTDRGRAETWVNL